MYRRFKATPDGWTEARNAAATAALVQPTGAHIVTTPVLPSSARRWLLGALALAFGGVLALGLAEIGLRIFNLAPSGGVATVDEKGFERLPGLFVPGQVVLDRRIPALQHRVTIDSLGYRGTREFSRLKPAGEFRLLMMGDSFTYGDFVNDDETLPAQLEQLLQSKCGPTIRVINIGVGGSSIETAEVMASRALSLGIDLAVLTFSENDVSDLAAPMWDRMTANRKSKSRFPLSVVYPVLRRLALWNLVLSAQAKLWNRRREAVVAPGAAVSTGPGNAAVPRLRQEYTTRLVRLRNSLAAANVPLALAIYPSHLTVYRLWTSDQIDWVRATADSIGVPRIDYTPALRADGRPVERLYLMPLDGHPSPAGYLVAAKVLAARADSLPGLAARCAAPTNVVRPNLN